MFFLSGCSSVGRASAFQAEGRGFESRRPLHLSPKGIGTRDQFYIKNRFISLVDAFLNLNYFARVAQSVERILGKDEVTSSILVAGSRYC